MTVRAKIEHRNAQVLLHLAPARAGAKDKPRPVLNDF